MLLWLVFWNCAYVISPYNTSLKSEPAFVTLVTEWRVIAPCLVASIVLGAWIAAGFRSNSGHYPTRRPGSLQRDQRADPAACGRSRALLIASRNCEFFTLGLMAVLAEAICRCGLEDPSRWHRGAHRHRVMRPLLASHTWGSPLGHDQPDGKPTSVPTGPISSRQDVSRGRGSTPATIWTIPAPKPISTPNCQARS